MLKAILLFATTAFATEAVYLCNGDNPYSPSGGPVSIMAYYNDISQSQNQQAPQDTAGVDNYGYVTWEGGAVSGTFSSGVTFTSHINSNAQSANTGDYVGYGSNGYSNFNCYKDNSKSSAQRLK